MTNTTNADATLLRSLYNAYVVHGHDAAGSVEMARAYRSTQIAALSISFIRKTKSAAYRIATLEDGSRFLAVRVGKREQWELVFSVARLGRLNAMRIAA